MCCDNPTDLGCINSCSDIITEIELTGTALYIVRFEFNGSEITRKFIASDNGSGFLAIPANLFNTSGPVTFALYDASDKYIGCYKFKVSPNTTLPTEEVQESSYLLDSSFTQVSKVCSNDVTTFVVSLQLSNYTAIYDGTVIALSTNFAIPTVARLGQASNSTITVSDDFKNLIVTDASAANATNMLFEVIVPNIGCSQQISLYIAVQSYSVLVEPFLPGNSQYIILST